MIAVIHVVGTPCCFRTYGLGHLLLVSVGDFDDINACAVCGAVYVKTRDYHDVLNFFSFENCQIKE